MICLIAENYEKCIFRQSLQNSHQSVVNFLSLYGLLDNEKLHDLTSRLADDTAWKWKVLRHSLDRYYINIF